MLRLVDYAGSDDDEDIAETRNDIGDASSVVANLPPSIRRSHVPVEQEKELDDLVKRKDWELKLAKKAQRKRKHTHKHHTKNSSKKINISENSTGTEISVKNKTRIIQAFGGLKGVADDKNGEKFDEQPSHSAAASSSANLLSILPEPRSASENSRKFMPSSRHSAKKVIISEDWMAKGAVEDNIFSGKESDDDSDDDYDSTDIFGLKATADLPQIQNVKSTLDVPCSRSLEQMKRRDDVDVRNEATASVQPCAGIGVESDASLSGESSGFIDDSHALHLIYARDVARLGGTFSNAAEALQNMADVSVDQVLGPNVQATLLKNLHNKSIAEAALSHLSNVPKCKNAVDMVARRKHQITYLASMAVAREEQLAEQWSQNRHNKRVSSRKYGF